MEILERKENNLLGRVEISFRWRHVGKSTPSRDELLNMIKTLEPGCSKDCIIVKDVDTRFGQPLTTGKAHVYAERSSMVVEPQYMLERHGIEADSLKAPSSKPAAVAAKTQDDGGEE